jgi:tetratricopeptide (TPR) repeat protein
MDTSFSSVARTALLGFVAILPSGALAMGTSTPPSNTPTLNAPDFDPSAEYRKGIEALKANNFSEAKTSFGRVLGVAPDDANTNFLAGMADAGLNDFKGAAKHYEKAVHADSKLVVAQQELAITYLKLGQRPKADAMLGKLKGLDADCKGTCKDADEIKKAIATIEAAMAQPTQAMLTTEPPFLFASAKAGDTAYLQAVELINEHKYQEAIEALQRAKVTFGAQPDVLTYLGFANRKLGRYDIAVSYYRQALAAAPNHKGATEYYGELMVERGDMVGAKRMLAKLDKLCTFGCAEADELRRWVEARGQPAP